MGKKRTSKAKRKVGAIKIKKIKKLKEPDKKKDSASNFFWAVKVLKKVANKPIEVSPQNLREVLSKCPHAVATWAGKSAILNAVQLMRDDLLYVLIEAGAIIQPPGTQVCENDVPEDGDDVNSEAKALVHSVVTDASVCAFLSKCADFPHNKLNDLLREADSADAVKALLTVGAQPNYFGSYGCTAIHEAAYSGRPVCLFTLLQRGGISFTRSAEGRTALHAAAIGGNIACVKVLITAGVSVRAIDYCAMTALHFAAGSSRSAGCVPLLVAAGANVNAKDKFDMTPLHYAAAYGTAETVKLLLDEGADREALDQWHRTPGHTVYSECDSRERKEARAPIYWLLNPEGGGDEQTWDNIEEDYLWDVEPPLPTSQQCQQDVNVLRQLACFGDVTLKEIKIVLNRSPPLVFSYSACKALQTCAEMGRLEIINAFLKKGASPHIRECDFCSDEVFDPFVDPGYLTSSCNDWPLIHIAAAAGQVQTVDTLLAAKASKKRVWVPEYADPFGPLEAAAASGHLAMVKYLLYSGCVADREQVDGALRLAVTPKGWQAGCKNWVEETQMRIARTLLDAGADPNARDLFGHTPVHGAACCGWSKCLSLLIRRGSKVQAETQNGKTALHIAACGRHIVCISLLIKARANVSSKDCLGQTPLHYVAEGLMQSDWAQTQCPKDDGAEIVKALVDAGADVNCHDKNGVTALHLAAKSGSFAVVEALLNAGASINAKDRNSRTALHYAADAGADCVVDKLIKSGADTNAKDRSGCIPHNHTKTNSASLVRSDAERKLENEDSEESERSWCGICSDDEWVEVESSGDDTDDWELECYRWVKELCKRSSDKEDREEVVESQLKQNTESKPNEAKQSKQDILLKSLREVETESEDDEESDDDCALDEGEEVDEFMKAMKNREKISKLSIKLRLRGYVDSDAEFESLPDEDAQHTYLPPGAISDPNAPWYNKQWIKENEVCNDNASQVRPSEVVSKSEADCQTEGKVDSRLKDSLLSEADHSGKVKREAEGKKECEEGQSNSVQDIQEPPVNQERDSQRDKRMKDEHEFTKELRIKVELDDDDDDDDDEDDDDDNDDDDDDEQNIPYVSGAWTVPQQSEKVGNKENDMWNRRDSKWRKGEGSSCTLGFRVESNAACWRAESTSSSNLLGREEEMEKGERRRGGVWLRLGKRSTDGDSDSPHNSIVVTRVLSENDERTLRYVEENSLEGWETKRKQEGKIKRQMYSQQRRFAGESKDRERCEAYEPDSPGLEGGFSHSLQNEVVSTHQLDESFSLTERWVSVCSESSERIVYVQDPRESIKTRDEQNTSGDLRNWCERPIDPTESGGCDDGSLEELQSGIRSNLFEVQESGRGRERHCSGKGYEREAFETHGEERRLFGVKAERGHRFRGAQAKQEENDWKAKKVQNVFRPRAEEDAIEKLYGWEEQISHTSIRAQDDHKGSRQNEGLSRNRSYRSYNQGRDNSSTASYDWERQDLLDIQERKKRDGSHERVSFECGTQRDFGERCYEFERLSDETGNKSRSHERVSFEHGRQRGFRERHNEFERVSDERGNKRGSREKESFEYQAQRGFGERQNQFKRIKDDRGNKTFECDDRLRKELRDYHTRLDAHKNEASCSTFRIYEDEVRMHRKLGVREQDGYCYQAGSNEEEYERPYSGYRLSEPDRMRPHSQYSEQEQNALHRYGEPVDQDRIQGQLRNAGENDPCKLLLIQEHHRSREQICEKALSPYDRIGRQEHDWSMEHARNIVGSQHSENWEKNSQDRLKEHEYRNLRSPRSRYDEQEHYRNASYRRQELEKNNQTSGRAYVVSHSQNRLEENASHSPRSQYDEQECYRSSGYGRQESERFSQTSAHGDVVSNSQNILEENEFGRLRSSKRRYDEQEYYRSSGCGRQESDKFSQTSARADVVSHSQNRLEENAFGRSQSPKSRYYDQEYYRSASYGRKESEKNSQTMGQADNGSCSPHRSQIRFSERKYGGLREQACDPSDIHYSDKEHERFHSYYTSRKLSHRSCSPFSRFGPQERDISDTHYGRQGPKLYDDRKSGEHVYDRSRSPCRRVSDEMQGRLHKNKAGEMRHDRSRIQFSGSDERDFRTHTQHRWPDILEDVPH